ncbi:metallophosphoesterase family protein [Deinococcus yavapaiensis]|uniref:Icc-related predicted phosphoesterase n=1 Tax=Deinococcus yavapaiensis KR-236 TaxID=694435 RepID=A0A318S676_9DEIO|nr:metallophosphoesterase [Deinococcus yavapaiensis]PYE53132.1 Icc-related predicted phosphoesterase [Deinococcus yavapaiensis KR-236]
MPRDTVRIAAVSDVHCTTSSRGALQPLFAHIAEHADVLLLPGDLTDYGTPDEARVLLDELAGIRLPTLAVLGNHDFESGRQDEVRAVLSEGGVKVLDGDAYEVHGIGFVGVKGFAGGFGGAALGAWGERTVKAFVQEALDEARKLEAALDRLHVSQKVAMLHYAPVSETVEGEPIEIFAFLGSSRLEEPLERHPVAAVVHGHAHAGSPQGRTRGGVPVFNVALPLMRRVHPDAPYRVIELRPDGSSAER